MDAGVWSRNSAQPHPGCDVGQELVILDYSHDYIMEEGEKNTFLAKYCARERFHRIDVQ